MCQGECCGAGAWTCVGMCWNCNIDDCRFKLSGCEREKKQAKMHTR